MATYAEMVTWVSKRLQDPNNTAVSTSDVGELINMALGYWKNERFWFNEITDLTVLTKSNPSIPLPDDYLVPSIDDGFVIEYSGIRYPLKKVSESQYNAMYLSNGIGQPWWYSRQADTEYKVYPIPDRDYDLRRFYLRNYAPFANENDTNAFSDLAPNLLQYTAAAWGSRDYRQDTVMYGTFWDMAKQEYQSILKTTRKANATGALTITSMLTSY